MYPPEFFFCVNNKFFFLADVFKYQTMTLFINLSFLLRPSESQQKPIQKQESLKPSKTNNLVLFPFLKYLEDERYRSTSSCRARQL